MLIRDPWRAVGRSMAVGAAYDAVFGAAILIALAPSAAVLGLEVPPEPTYLRLCGVFLLMLAAMYAAAARDPFRYVAVVVTAGVGRSAGFVLLVVAGLRSGEVAFTVLGTVDLLFGVVHLALLARARRPAGGGAGA